jgi:hypothetical protein
MSWSHAIAEQHEEGVSWRSCTGCHETEDGYDVGHYRYSRVFRCKVGSGCRECGGLGVIVDNTDYSDLADWHIEREAKAKAAKIARRRLAWLRVDVETFMRGHGGYEDSDGAWTPLELIEQLRAMLEEEFM